MGSRATAHACVEQGVWLSASSDAVLLWEKDACPQVQSGLSLPLSTAEFPPWGLSHQEQMIRLLILHI